MKFTGFDYIRIWIAAMIGTATSALLFISNTTTMAYAPLLGASLTVLFFYVVDQTQLLISQYLFERRLSKTIKQLEKEGRLNNDRNSSSDNNSSE